MTAEQLIESIAGIYADCIKTVLDEVRKNIRNNSRDPGTLVENAARSAYCEGLEQALFIVSECTAAVLKELAGRRTEQ